MVANWTAAGSDWGRGVLQAVGDSEL